MIKNDLNYIPVKTNEDIEEISKLADDIWNEYYCSILTTAQIEYMLKNFQSPEAILNQIQNNSYRYYFLKVQNEIAGYIGIQVDKSKLFLSKIYIKKEFRNKGLATASISFLDNFCRFNKLNTIWLTVNKKNRASIDAYRKMGFKITNTLVTDIGSGYVMDDYLMERECC